MRKKSRCPYCAHFARKETYGGNVGAVHMCQADDLGGGPLRDVNELWVRRPRRVVQLREQQRNRGKNRHFSRPRTGHDIVPYGLPSFETQAPERDVWSSIGLRHHLHGLQEIISMESNRELRHHRAGELPGGRGGWIHSARSFSVGRAKCFPPQRGSKGAYAHGFSVGKASGFRCKRGRNGASYRPGAEDHHGPREGEA